MSEIPPYKLTIYQNEEFQEIMNYSEQLVKQIIKSTIEDIPLIGDVFKLKKETANKLEMENIKNTIFHLKTTIDKIITNEKVDKEYVEKQQREIYFMIKTLMAVSYNQADEKQIEYLAKYVGSCMDREFSDLFVKSNILNKIAKYSRQHIHVLKELYKDWLQNKKDDGDYNDDYILQNQIDNINEIDKNTLQFCANDLFRDGFLTQHVGFALTTDNSPYVITDIGIKCLMMTVYK